MSFLRDFFPPFRSLLDAIMNSRTLPGPPLPPPADPEPATPKTATCTRCNIPKPIDLFPLIVPQYGVRRSWCIECIDKLEPMFPPSSSVGAPHAAPASSSPDDSPAFETRTCIRCAESKPIDSFTASVYPYNTLAGCRECRDATFFSSSAWSPHVAPDSSSPDDAPETQTCKRCIESKPIESFKPRFADGGLHIWCKECRNIPIGAKPVAALAADPASSSDQYAPLRQALDDAFQRATRHKGAERHGEEGVDFLDQIGPMIARNKLRWTLGQIAKKAFECERVTPDHAQKELHDIIIIATIEILNLEMNGNTNHTNE